MTKVLHILDHLLEDYGGHPFNYDTAVAEAAATAFDRVGIACGIGFSDAAAHGMTPVFPDPNRSFPVRVLRTLTGWIPAGSSARHEVGCVSWQPGGRRNRWFKHMRALSFARAAGGYLRPRLREADETHVLFPSADHFVLLAAERLAGSVRFAEGSTFHLVLRVEPLIFCSRLEQPGRLAERLARLAAYKNVAFRFYTDTGELSREYAKFAGCDVFPVLPIPVLSVPAEREPVHYDDAALRLGVMGVPRVEKGAALLPELVASLPERVRGRRVELLLQKDERNRERETAAILKRLEDMTRNGPVRLLFCPGSLPPEEYGAAHAATDIALLLYTSPRYRCSSSGIMADCLRLGVPVIAFRDSWMGGIIEDARSRGLAIGKAIGRAADFPDAVAAVAAGLEAFKQDVRAYYRIWAKDNAMEKFVDMLLAR